MCNDIKIFTKLRKLNKIIQLCCVLETISVIWSLLRAAHLSTLSVGIVSSVVFPVKNRQAFPEFLPSSIAGHVCQIRNFSVPHRQKSEAVSSGDFGGQKSLQLGERNRPG